MDGLSAAVNILSVLDLSLKGLDFLSKYCSDVREAQASLDQLRGCLTQELYALQEALTLYERLSTQTELSPHTLQSVAALERLLQEDSNGFYADLQEFIQWLEKYTAKSGAKPLQRIARSLKPKRIARFFKSKRVQGSAASEDPCSGLSLSQKLKWPVVGKKKIEKIMPQLQWHKSQLSTMLQHIQLYVPPC